MIFNGAFNFQVKAQVFTNPNVQITRCHIFVTQARITRSRKLIYNIRAKCRWNTSLQLKILQYFKNFIDRIYFHIKLKFRVDNVLQFIDKPSGVMAKIRRMGI